MGVVGENLSDYRDTIPRFLHPNGFVILSNGQEAVMGPSHAAFEDFAPWKKLDPTWTVLADLSVENGGNVRGPGSLPRCAVLNYFNGYTLTVDV
jgi:hypothetical protein